MNRERLEQMVLLESSGELGVFRRWQLRRELARHAELRSFRDALLGLHAEAPRHTFAAVPDLPRDVRAAILLAAEQRTRPKTASLSWSLRGISACAAALMIAAGLRMTWHPPGSSPPAPKPNDARIVWDDAWDEQMAALKGELSRTGSDWADPTTLGEELDAMAGFLLSAEGVQI